jgi:crotonobetainyl-CoA:carnitine CoA-transferase CaiB-like acyl-CoA transferase
VTGPDLDDGPVRLLEDVRVLEVAALSPCALGMHLADLGATVVKVEEPNRGDPTRTVGRREGMAESGLHRKWNRGKQSVAIDLGHPAGRQIFLGLVAKTDVVIEGLRPGTLGRSGLGYEQLVAVNPRLVFVSVSGFGYTGPYRDLPSHGPAFEAVAGLAPADRDSMDRPRIPASAGRIGIVVAPALAAMGTLAALWWSRRSGQPSFVDVAQLDAAVFANAHALEDLESDRRRAGFDLAASGPAWGMDRAARGDLFGESVTVQYYPTSDGRLVLLMALERKLWERFTTAIDRADLLAEFPADKHADHLWGNHRVRAELTEIFSTRTLPEWIAFFHDHAVPGVPVNDDADVLADPQFLDRATWLAADDGAVTLGTPLQVRPELATPERAPSLGQHTRDVLANLGMDDDEIDALEQSGTIRASR